MRFVLNTLLAFPALLLSAAAMAQDAEPDINAVADAYLEAYQAFDIDRIETLVTEDFDFSDPTSDTLPNPFNYSGRDTVLSNWRAYRSTVDTHRFEYSIERRYAYSGHVVLIGQIAFYATGNGTEASGHAPIVTILTVRDGQVAAHRDYADYESFFANTVRTPENAEAEEASE